MTGKFSFERVGNFLLALSGVTTVVMLLLSTTIGRYLIIAAHLFLYIGLLCALIGGAINRKAPWVQIQLSVILFLALVVLGPVVVAATSVDFLRRFR